VEYRNYIADFPGRLAELLRCCPAIQVKDHDVTLLLAVATSGIISPWERFQKPIPRSRNPHKRLGHQQMDWDTYEMARQKFEKLLHEDFLGSRLWRDSNPGSWQRVNDLDDASMGIGGWPIALHYKEENWAGYKVDYLLQFLRNSLAHSNFEARGNPISHLRFHGHYGSVIRYEVLDVSIPDFQEFLNNWFGFLKTLEKSMQTREFGCYNPGEHQGHAAID